MNPAAGKNCALKSGLFHVCNQPAIGLCQYCARPFCAKHGTVMDEAQEVCNRPNCVSKRDDLVVHLVYKARATQLNATGRCGVEGCGARMTEECVRCEQLFCEVHASPREDIFITENKVRIKRMANLCEHCQK